jgi:hypothetical protein
MESTNLPDLTWHKSSYSVHENCVEVAYAGDAVAVRDSKDPEGPVLFVPRTAFGCFVHSL